VRKDVDTRATGVIKERSKNPFQSKKGGKHMPATAKKKVAKSKKVVKAKKVVKPKKVAKPKAVAKKGPALQCGVCGMRVVVDRACGCATAHPIVCCGKPMKKKKA
jgi:hypothetical protein